MQITFNKLPGFNEFFIDYINDFNSLKGFFNYSYVEKENIFKSLVDREDNYLNKKLFTRNDLADILMSQNKFFNASETTIKNIESLRNENTFAVVTGQQAGIL
ncbi:MAG: bacillithiol biosynthesis BshC, partial [Ignavibacteria bacterium]